jgi:hypothetical protein
VICTVFNEVCRLAGVEGHTSHDARPAMGRHLIEKTGNIGKDRGSFSRLNNESKLRFW